MPQRGGAPERPRRHSAELYDRIWELDVPPIVLTEGKRAGRLKRDGTPVVEVGPTAVRLVLMALARHTNPSRDQSLGPAHEWRCCPTVDTIAELADVNPRQVQLVLSTFVGLGYIEVERAGQRAGRGRPARPTWWCLRPDRWPRRSLNGREAGFVTIDDVALVAKPAPMVAKPASSLSNGREAGFAVTAMVAKPASPEPGSSLTRNTGDKPGKKPARARALSGEVEKTTESAETTGGHQVALPLTSAVQIDQPGKAAGEALVEGQRIWGAARQQLLYPAAGADAALVARARNTGTAGYDVAEHVLTLDGDLVADDLAPDGPIARAVVAAADGVQVNIRLVGSTAASKVAASA